MKTNSKNFLIGALIGLAIAGVFLASSFFAQPQSTPCAVTPILSPGAGGQIVSFLDSAQSTIDVLLYQFSSNELKQAISNAAARGVKIRFILEPKVDDNFAAADYLAKAGVQVKWANPKYANSHAKLAVVDGKKALVGSINWSYNALNRNREAAVILYCQTAVQEYEKAFEEDWSGALEKPAQS
ncbi:hypothetical protein HY993_01605 [Candidatus Micrarchaeota archaeon]|nr:hypothetical protein [Candidatus Micrarchaeota archaeon]